MMRVVWVVLLAGLSLLPAAEPNAELLKTIQDEDATVADRDAAIRQLVQNAAGARVLIGLAEKGALGDEIKPSAAYALAGSGDEAIRKLGAEKLPLPKTRDGKSIPPLKELFAMPVDAVRGQAVFNDAKSANCASCHVLGDKGRDIGPPLNTIGEKEKEILLESIMVPSVAIQHGFHMALVRTKTQGVKTGLLVEENDEKITLRDTQGEYIDIPAAEVVKKKDLPNSMMPDGLVSTMTLQELVDLIEYLSKQKVQ